MAEPAYIPRLLERYRSEVVGRVLDSQIEDLVSKFPYPCLELFRR